MIDASRTAVLEALDEHQKSRQQYFNGFTPEQHKAHHEFLGGWLDFWNDTGLTIRQGLKDGLKRLIAILVLATFIAFVFTVAGSVISPEMRKWLITLLGG